MAQTLNNIFGIEIAGTAYGNKRNPCGYVYIVESSPDGQ